MRKLIHAMDVCGNGLPLVNSCKINNLNKFNVFEKTEPQFINYISSDLRAKSFTPDIWNKYPVLVSDLVQIGFFALDHKDSVRCYCCGGGIIDWEYEDDPFIEHQKHFPDCLLVKLNKDDIDKRKKLFSVEAIRTILEWRSEDIVNTLKYVDATEAQIKYLLLKRFAKGKDNYQLFADAYEDFRTEEKEDPAPINPCKVCHIREISVAFLPCGHACCCSYCAPCLNTCPIGKEVINGCVKIFLT
jgi:E3 ubiquitin-protein ligase XIAP